MKMKIKFDAVGCALGIVLLLLFAVAVVVVCLIARG